MKSTKSRKGHRLKKSPLQMSYPWTRHSSIWSLLVVDGMVWGWARPSGEIICPFAESPVLFWSWIVLSHFHTPMPTREHVRAHIHIPYSLILLGESQAHHSLWAVSWRTVPGRELIEIIRGQRSRQRRRIEFINHNLSTWHSKRCQAKYLLANDAKKLI